VAKDLVCGMNVDEKDSQYTSTYKGKIYYFCAPGCKKIFEAIPEKYVGGSSKN
jgi:YHS domain-containing protein